MSFKVDSETGWLVAGKELNASARSLVVFAELQLWHTSMGEEPADSRGLHLAGLCDVGVEAAGDLGCEALDPPADSGSVWMKRSHWMRPVSCGRRHLGHTATSWD